MCPMKKLKPLDQCKFQSVKQLFSTPKRWTKGEFFNADNTACCLMGAIDTVEHHTGKDYFNMIDKLKRVIAKKTKKAYHSISIPEYNDSPKRTFEDIKEVVELARI